ncbi:hypothetical protein MAR_007846 [Mya arenaria]|uniref:Uncharacterized protein n=1 Tax=Mya arenaria TaxID=6604 RepID=A0ABY7DU77_MYAAR|nr:hypothetical protein MAR_007846 [Mya arenaria]
MDSSPKSMDKLAMLTAAEGRFQRACDQIVLLNIRLEDTQKRYKRAKNENHRVFRYPLRLRLASIEGVRNMYYDYAFNMAERVAELRQELFNETVEIVSVSGPKA